MKLKILNIIKALIAFLFVLNISFLTVLGQVPEKMSYQAIIRDTENNLVTSQQVGMQISILQGSADGTPVYVETQTPTTNKNGLVTLEIGTGSTSDDFSGIDWSKGPYFINTETDPEGGTNFSITGTSQLLSVPYAFHAQTSDSTLNSSISGNEKVFDKWDKDTSNDFSGSYNDLTNVPVNIDTDSTNDFSGDYNELINLPDLGLKLDTAETANWDKDTADDFSGSYNDLANIPLNMDTDSTDDFSGDYNDLQNPPDLSAYATKDMNKQNIFNLADPVNEKDAVNKLFVTLRVSQTGDTLFLGPEQFVIIPGISEANERGGEVNDTMLTDIDGNTYQTVTIGNQTWMAENLATTRYNDGSAIPNVTDNSEWAGLSTPAYCWYDNDEASYKDTYGALYNWYAVETGKLCPDGWHVPADDEWTELEDFISNDGHSGSEGTALKATSGWNNDGNGTDDYGFTALPCGIRYNHDGEFGNEGEYVAWWSATELITDTAAWGRDMSYDYSDVDRVSGDMEFGLSVRCLKDGSQQTNQPPAAPGTPQPSDGASAIDTETTLQWNCSDPEGDALNYDVYLDSTDASTLVSQDQSDSTYAAGTLEYSATYYWKIVAKDGNGNQTTSATWSFTTMADTSSTSSWPQDTITAVVDVTNPATGKTWMDRNLGASQVATSSTDAAAYGDLYQWGRSADGHESRTSGTTSTLATSDTPGHGDFITNGSNPYDWRNPQNDNLWQGVSGINNPCPNGYRLPTEAEWEAERASWSSNNDEGAFASPLKLPVAGRRFNSDGTLSSVGSFGYYWSGTVDGTNASYLYFGSSAASMDSYIRAYGFSVRCLKD